MNFDNEMDPTIGSLHGVVKDNVSSNLPQIPNYTKNPELELEKTVAQLKGNGDLTKFKKDIQVAAQKIQPAIKQGNIKTVPQELLDQHVNQITAMGAQMGHNGPQFVQMPQSQNAPRGPMKCKFLSSSKCHPDYPNFSGASINFPEGMKMKCDSAGDEVLPKAICTISGGKISGVYVIQKGYGLGSAPKIEIVGGGGRGAVLKGVIQNGSMVDIKVMNPGEGYHETPQVKIESPSMSSGCHLCCK